MLTKTLKLLLLAFASASIVACGGSDDDDFDDRASIADPKLRFVHAVSGGPNVTLFRNEQRDNDADNVAYTFASQYYDIGSGGTTLSLRLAATEATKLGNDIRFDADRGNKYTAVALPATGGAEMLLIDDPYNKGLTSDDARVRVLNASANATNVDVYLTAPTVDLATVGPNFGAVEYKEALPASGSDSVELNGGTYRLRITAVGSKTPIFSADVTLDDNADWLLLTVPTDGTVTAAANDIKVLLVKSDDSSNASVEIVSQPLP